MRSPASAAPAEAIAPPAPGITVVLVAHTVGALAMVGGMSLVLRGVLTLREGGFSDIVIFAGDQTAAVAKLLAARGPCADVRWVGLPDQLSAPPWREPALVVSADLLFDPGVFAPLLRMAGSARIRVGTSPTSGSRRIYAGVCPPAFLPTLLSALTHGADSLDEAIRRLPGSDSPPVPLAGGLFAPWEAPPSSAVLTRALLKDLSGRTAKTDGYLAALLDRPLSRGITRCLLPWPVTPNQITVAGGVIGLLGAVGLASVSYAGRLAGVLALLASSVLDGVDGEVARARFQQSRRGARLDLAGDYLTHAATFLGLGVGLVRQGLPPLGLWAAVLLIGGLGAAMATMHALVVQPALRATGDLHGGPGSPANSGRPSSAMVERLAGRDYTYLLLVLACLGHLDWFLYGAAVGSWLFVAALLCYGIRWRKSAPATAYGARPLELPLADGRARPPRARQPRVQ